MSEPTTLSVELAEIIRCRCGCLFAACVDGLQDRKWNARKAKFLSSGCSVSLVEMKDVKLDSCDCEKMKSPQLKLFDDE